MTTIIPGLGGERYTPYDERRGNESIVYFTRDLTAGGLRRLYARVNGNIRGKVAIKLHTGEQYGPNIIPHQWVEELVKRDLPEAAIVETNTFYEGDRDPGDQRLDLLPCGHHRRRGHCGSAREGRQVVRPHDRGQDPYRLRFPCCADPLQGPHHGRLRRQQQEHRHRLCRRQNRQEDDPPA